MSPSAKKTGSPLYSILPTVIVTIVLIVQKIQSSSFYVAKFSKISKYMFVRERKYRKLVNLLLNLNFKTQF